MTTFERVLAIGKPYLGPAAENFIARQCKSHLKVEPQGLTASHVRDLAKWMELGAGLIMDPAKAAEMGKKVAAIN
jgi:hypothetical protein